MKGSKHLDSPASLLQLSVIFEEPGEREDMAAKTERETFLNTVPVNNPFNATLVSSHNAATVYHYFHKKLTCKIACYVLSTWSYFCQSLFCLRRSSVSACLNTL